MRALPAGELLDLWEKGLAQPRWEWARQMVAATHPELSSHALDTMAVGRRDRLLLDWHEAFFGPKLACRSDCPSCGEPVELTIDVAAIRLDEVPSPPTPIREANFVLHFRVPNLSDLEHAARATHAPAMRNRLLERCMVTVEREGVAARFSDAPATAVDRVLESMALADPQADVQLDLKCPACDKTWSESFDIVTFSWAELQVWAERLLGQIHVLASAYGWSEAEILDLSVPRRTRYLEMAGYE